MLPSNCLPRKVKRPLNAPPTPSGPAEVFFTSKAVVLQRGRFSEFDTKANTSSAGLLITNLISIVAMVSAPSVSDSLGKTRYENYIIIVLPKQAKRLPKAANLGTLSEMAMSNGFLFHFCELE